MQNQKSINDCIQAEIEKLRGDFRDGALVIWVAEKIHIHNIDAVARAAAAAGYDVRCPADADIVIFFNPPRVVRAGEARYVVMTGNSKLAIAPEFPMAEIAQEWIDKKFPRITDGKLYPECAINPGLIDRE